MIERNEKNTRCDCSVTHRAANVCTNVHSQPRFPSRNTAAFEVAGKRGERGSPPRERSYPSISPSVLKSILRIPHLRSALRPKPGFDEAEKAGKVGGIAGRGEKRERIQFLGCILKSVDLSTATRTNTGSDKVDEPRVFSLYVHFDLNLIRLISSLFLHPPQVGRLSSRR